MLAKEFSGKHSLGLELRSAERVKIEIDWYTNFRGMYREELERSQKPRGDREGE